MGRTQRRRPGMRLPACSLCWILSCSDVCIFRREMAFFFPSFDPRSFPIEEATTLWERGQLQIDWDKFEHSSSWSGSTWPPFSLKVRSSYVLIEQKHHCWMYIFAARLKDHASSASPLHLQISHKVGQDLKYFAVTMWGANAMRYSALYLVFLKGHLWRALLSVVSKSCKS